MTNKLLSLSLLLFLCVIVLFGCNNTFRSGLPATFSDTKSATCYVESDNKQTVYIDWSFIPQGKGSSFYISMYENDYPIKLFGVYCPSNQNETNDWVWNCSSGLYRIEIETTNVKNWMVTVNNTQ